MLELSIAGKVFGANKIPDAFLKQLRDYDLSAVLKIRNNPTLNPKSYLQESYGVLKCNMSFRLPRSNHNITNQFYDFDVTGISSPNDATLFCVLYTKYYRDVHKINIIFHRTRLQSFTDIMGTEEFLDADYVKNLVQEEFDILNDIVPSKCREL